jgi:CheY-like chemotaxis protein
MERATRRILVTVVDDEDPSRDVIRHILESAGYTVDEVSDGTQAVSKIERTQPDLVILDLRMPSVDGWAVLAALRGLPDPPRVLVVSADHLPQPELERLIEAGATAYVSKPFSIATLLGVCARVLAGEGGDGPPTH